MRKFAKDERFPARNDRDAAPLLSVEEQLDSVILELTRPSQVNGKEATEITINAPTPDDILDIENRDADAKMTNYKKLADATGATADEIKNLHARDFNRLREIFWGFTV